MDERLRLGHAGQHATTRTPLAGELPTVRFALSPVPRAEYGALRRTVYTALMWNLRSCQASDVPLA
jgi:hypothetical protein